MILNSTAHALQESVIQSRVLKFFPLLFVWGSLGVIAIVANVIFLLLSKFTTGGKSPVLVFMRSICLADVMIGLYAILKAIVFYSLEHTNVNCFLPDSIFITATTASISSLVWLHLDCCLRFTHPLRYILHMKKDNVVTGVVIMWNVSFVLGFLPLMGWNNVDALCSYSDFYTPEYVVFISVLWCIGLFSNVFMESILKYYIQKVKHNQHLLTVNSREFQRFQNLIQTNRIELVGWFTCIALLGICIVLGVRVFNRLTDFDRIEVYVLCMMPIFLLRPCILSVVRSYKTTQIHTATQRLKRQVTRIVRKHQPASKVNSTTETIRSSVDSNKSTDANNSLKASFRRNGPSEDINTISKDCVHSQSSDSQGSGACTSGLHNKTMECSTAVDNPVFNMADECMCSSTLPVPVFCENGLPQTETSVDISDVITHL